MKKASAKGCKCMATPLLGAGNNGFEDMESFELFKEAVQESSIDIDVVLVLYDSGFHVVNEVMPLDKEDIFVDSDYVSKNRKKYLFELTAENFEIYRERLIYELRHWNSKLKLSRKDKVNLAKDTVVEVKGDLTSGVSTSQLIDEWGVIILPNGIQIDALFYHYAEKYGKGDVSDSQIVKDAGVDKDFVSRIKNPKKNRDSSYTPNTDYMLRVALSWGMTAEDIVKFVKGMGCLKFPLGKREEFIVEQLEAGNLTIDGIDDALYSNNMECLKSPTSKTKE